MTSAPNPPASDTKAAPPKLPFWKQLVGRAIPPSLMMDFAHSDAAPAVEALLWLGFPIEKPLRHDRQRLAHYATYSRSTRILKAACQAGADLETFGDCGLTPLVQALRRNYLPMVAELLAQGASPNTRCNGNPPHKLHGEIPLAAALRHCHGAIPLLLDAGADPLALGPFLECDQTAHGPIGFFFEETLCDDLPFSTHARDDCFNPNARKIILSAIEAMALAQSIAPACDAPSARRARL